MRPVRIAFVGHFLYNSGCSQAISGYIRASNLLGFDIKILDLSLMDNVVLNRFPIADISWNPDILVIIFESYQYLDEKSIDCIVRNIPRNRRVVIDHDGNYSRTIKVSNDTNHDNRFDRKRWETLYRRLSDKILQPSINVTTPEITKFIFFGIDSQIELQNHMNEDKVFGITYVGNNWYRWQEMHDFIEAISHIRSKLGRIAIFGKWWSGATLPSHSAETFSDPLFLKKHRIEIYDSVPFGQVVSGMSRGYLNPIFIRPLLRKLEFITPRMFETFRANSVPLIPPSFSYAEALYGRDVHHFSWAGNPAEKIEHILSNYKEIDNIKCEISNALEKNHSYENRLVELINFF